MNSIVIGKTSGSLADGVQFAAQPNNPNQKFCFPPEACAVEGDGSSVFGVSLTTTHEDWF